ncbi:MAG TPA: cyclase family protein [Acidimicrobiales bacterium]|nr:cyclase family protein [Acidimicrobiales bacterium]
MTRIIDITRPLRGDMEVYPGDPPVSITSMVLGGARVSALQFGSHTGTHVDAPLHFVDGGYGVDELPLDALVGPAVVSREVVPAERLLLLDGNLSVDDAQMLVDNGLRLVGTDRITIEEEGGEHPVHKLLLAAGVVILETLDLSAVEPGTYQLVCLPLKIEGCDGAPARAILISD